MSDKLWVPYFNQINLEQMNPDKMRKRITVTLRSSPPLKLESGTLHDFNVHSGLVTIMQATVNQKKANFYVEDVLTVSEESHVP